MDTENKIVYEENLGLNDSISNLSSYNGLANRKVNDDKEESDKTIYDKDATGITVKPSTVKLSIGGKLKLSVEPNVFTNNPPTVVWESSNPTIAYVNSDGIVFGIQEGEVTITATNSEDTTITSTLNVKVSANSKVTPTPAPIGGPNQVGDILCSDGSYITPTLNWETGECTAIDLEGKTPIGIVVVPGSHTPDNTERIMSLLECDLDNPSTPTAEHKDISWGTHLIDMPELTNYNTFPLEFSIEGITVDDLLQKGGAIGIGTKWSINLIGQEPTIYEENGLYYAFSKTQAIESVGLVFAKPTYLSDGITQNPESLVGAFSDFNGKENTEVILTYATSDESWKTGSITNVNYNNPDPGYYPAIFCCYRYNTPGTQEGDWYLPAAGELVYVVYHIKLFQSILSKLNELNSGSAVEMGNNYYWSSSEYESINYQDVNYSLAYSVNPGGLMCACNKARSFGISVRPFYKPTHS